MAGRTAAPTRPSERRAFSRAVLDADRQRLDRLGRSVAALAHPDPWRSLRVGLAVVAALLAAADDRDDIDATMARAAVLVAERAGWAPIASAPRVAALLDASTGRGESSLTTAEVLLLCPIVVAALLGGAPGLRGRLDEVLDTVDVARRL